GMPHGTVQPGLTLDQVFAACNRYLTLVTPYLQAAAAQGQSYGLALTAYEGGQALPDDAGTLGESLVLQAQSDPRMFQLYVSLMNLWNQVGGSVMNQYTLTDSSGYWGLLSNVLSKGNPKWNGLISQIFP